LFLFHLSAGVQLQVEGLPDVAGPVIGRAFARPVGSSGLTIDRLKREQRIWQAMTD
jgi:hypothetical protein